MMVRLCDWQLNGSRIELSEGISGIRAGYTVVPAGRLDRGIGQIVGRD